MKWANLAPLIALPWPEFVIVVAQLLIISLFGKQAQVLELY
jgi:hypothetical protein